MKKDYSVDEMKKIMGQDMEVPKSVDEGMKKAYDSWNSDHEKTQQKI